MYKMVGVECACTICASGNTIITHPIIQNYLQSFFAYLPAFEKAFDLKDQTWEAVAGVLKHVALIRCCEATVISFSKAHAMVT